MKKRLLVVVDYQKDFVDGALGFEGAEKLDKVIAEKVREYGKGNVIVLKDTHNEGYLKTREGKALPVEHCIKGTEGHELYGETKEAVKEIGAIQLEKETFGVDPRKVEVYGIREYDEIEVAGLVTNMCVISNVCVFQAMNPEAQIKVDKRACASFDLDLHNKALDVLKGLQVQILD